METMESSIVGRRLLSLWRVICLFWAQGGLSRLSRAVSEGFNELWRESALAALLERNGVLNRAWRHSVFCVFLNTLVNLPAALLHWIYLKLKPVFDGSIAAQLAFGMAEQTPAAIGWLFLGIILIPYKQWNNLYSLIGFFLILLLAIAGGMHRRSLRLDVTSMGPYAALYALAVILAVPLSAFPALSFRFLFFHITCMLCVITTVSTIEREDQLMRLVAFAVLGLLAVSAAGIVQGIIGVAVNPSYVDLTVNEGMPGRIYAMFENPNAFAEVLAMLIPLAAALMLASKGWWGRILGFVSCLLGLVSILMTYGRASWIGLAVSAVVFVFLWNRKLLPVMILVGLAAIPVLPSSVFNRILTIFNTKDTSTSSRFPLYSAALRLLAARPLIGAGLGTDAVRQAVKDLNFYHGVAPFVHAHDVYLQVWAESGLLGIFSFVGAMGWSIKNAAKAAASDSCPKQVRLIAIGGASALFGLLVCGIADYMWNYPRVMVIFWFVVGVTLSAIRLAKKSVHSASEIRQPSEGGTL
ncbi:hypothetical protein SDC9_61551 [bioreactor metagenome]|uniref:O-antigen ligase-related domain-containing protein n=1 Tax=bioreactor metagenome TaxID=1076179 RepID=A0A644XG30_9ZZZZ